MSCQQDAGLLATLNSPWKHIHEKQNSIYTHPRTRYTNQGNLSKRIRICMDLMSVRERYRQTQKDYSVTTGV